MAVPCSLSLLIMPKSAVISRISGAVRPNGGKILYEGREYEAMTPTLLIGYGQSADRNRNIHINSEGPHQFLRFSIHQLSVYHSTFCKLIAQKNIFRIAADR